ncbi:hypothetical protein W153_01896, partial [Staphylococcus aureus DAR3761]|uniref:DUF1024 family protein n=1 Tax=Staphylococcus aureus TaxID=1280 RepID=UPI0004516CCB
EIEDVYKKAQAFDEILEGMTNAMQDALKEDIRINSRMKHNARKVRVIGDDFRERDAW